MSKSITVELPENLTISGVEKLHQELEVIAQQDKSVVIDASRVAKVDTAGVQLVCALVMDLAKHNLAYSWGEVSEVFRNASRILGLEGKMGLIDQK